MMRKNFARIFTAILVGIFFVSCNSAQTTDAPSTAESFSIPSKESTPSATLTTTATPTIAFTSTAIVTVPAATSAQATIEAFSDLCTNSKEPYHPELSPDGKWIAADCISENGTEDSPLQITSIDHSKTWKLYYRDYIKGNSLYDHHDIPVPYHWSKDGEFLYVLVGSRLEGCCWVGHRYTLLVRLNLETGKPLELFNATDYNSTTPFDFIIADSEHYLLFTPPTEQDYDIGILDLETRKTKPVSLKLLENFDLYYAVLSPEENKLVLPTYEWHEELRAYTMDSIALIDLKTDKEKILVSGLSSEKEFYPVRWLDNTHVLLNTVNPYYRDYPAYSAEDWIVDINTGKLVKAEKP